MNARSRNEGQGTQGWAEHLRVPADMRKVLGQPFDLGLVLLGDSYLKACRFDERVELGGPTLVFCGSTIARKFPPFRESNGHPY